MLRMLALLMAVSFLNVGCGGEGDDDPTPGEEVNFEKLFSTVAQDGMWLYAGPFLATDAWLGLFVTGDEDEYVFNPVKSVGEATDYEQNDVWCWTAGSRETEYVDGYDPWVRAVQTSVTHTDECGGGAYIGNTAVLLYHNFGGKAPEDYSLMGYIPVEETTELDIEPFPEPYWDGGMSDMYYWCPSASNARDGSGNGECTDFPDKPPIAFVCIPGSLPPGKDECEPNL